MIFVLDTNVLSALMSPRLPERVDTWVSSQPKSSLFTTTICQAEILAGLTVMPLGRRRSALIEIAQTILMDNL